MRLVNRKEAAKELKCSPPTFDTRYRYKKYFPRIVYDNGTERYDADKFERFNELYMSN